jgi:heme-degrading monooxygenase HmoA
MGISPIEWSSLLPKQPGFLGVDNVRGPSGFGITISYWASEEAITAWKAHPEHKPAQEAGKGVWYADYHVRVARVERAYGKMHFADGRERTIRSNQAD